MDQFNKPNLNAPRFREKKHRLLNIKLYNQFIEKFPEHQSVSYEEFKEIIHTFNQLLWEGVIDNRNGVELPEGLGYLFIGSCKPNKRNKNVDFKKSTDYGVTATHRNMDSDSYVMKIFFTNSKVKYRLPNKQLWTFRAVRNFKREASKKYRLQFSMYIVVDSTKKVAAMFDKIKQKEYLDKKGSEVSDDYNEFDY